jgi:hypothetical protein
LDGDIFWAGIRNAERNEGTDIIDRVAIIKLRLKITLNCGLER